MRKQAIIAASAACLLTASCIADDGQNTVIGALGGAVGGAVIGGLFGDWEGALIGAGIGALAGGAVGYYMDEQEAEMRRELENSRLEVERAKNDLIITMPGNVSFATGSAAINPGFYDELNSIAQVLSKYEKSMIEVRGYTDSRGSEDYNYDLSERRAASVKDYLTGRGVRDVRIRTVGMGEADPVATNDTTDGQAMNRRVEMTISPLTET